MKRIFLCLHLGNLQHMQSSERVTEQDHLEFLQIRVLPDIAQHFPDRSTDQSGILRNISGSADSGGLGKHPVHGTAHGGDGIAVPVQELGKSQLHTAAGRDKAVHLHPAHHVLAHV